MTVLTVQASDCGPARGQHGSVCKLSLQNLPRTDPLRLRGLFVSGANRWGLGRFTLYTGLKAASCGTWLDGHSPELMKSWGFPKQHVGPETSLETPTLTVHPALPGTRLPQTLATTTLFLANGTKATSNVAEEYGPQDACDTGSQDRRWLDAHTNTHMYTSSPYNICTQCIHICSQTHMHTHVPKHRNKWKEVQTLAERGAHELK